MDFEFRGPIRMLRRSKLAAYPTRLVSGHFSLFHGFEVEGEPLLFMSRDLLLKCRQIRWPREYEVTIRLIKERAICYAGCSKFPPIHACAGIIAFAIDRVPSDDGVVRLLLMTRAEAPEVPEGEIPF